MANEEHVAMLKRGWDAWNTWRDENRNIIPDLSEADLSRARLDGFVGPIAGTPFLSRPNLAGVNFTRANLFEANLSRTNLAEANLSEAKLMGAILAEANLSETKLMGAILTEANLSEANLSGAN